MPLKWGILGAGNISGQFVHDLVLHNKRGGTTHVIASVGSSSVDKGRRFLDTHEVVPENNQGVVAQSQDYESFFQNPDIDVIYVGTPHTFHKEQALRAIRNGKHVLCEKPFTVTGAETKAVLAAAEKTNLFVMEAVWTRFFPIVHKARKLIYEDNVIGDVHRMFADFSSSMDIASMSPHSRARNIELAAGATLDIGIYPLTYCRALFDPTGHSEFDIKSFLTLDPVDHVDHLATYIVKFRDGKQAVLTSSNYVNGPSPFLRVEGTLGTLEMYAVNPAQPRKLKVVFNDRSKPAIEIDDDIVSSGYNGFIYEADATAASIGAGKQTADQMPWAETQLVMDTMDKIRRENGLFYKADN